MRKYASSTIALRNLSICIAMLLVSSVWAAAQQEEVVYSFGTKAGDGIGFPLRTWVCSESCRR